MPRSRISRSIAAISIGTNAEGTSLPVSVMMIRHPRHLAHVVADVGREIRQLAIFDKRFRLVPNG